MKITKREFPKTRLRRARMKSFSRKMVSENRLSKNDLIWPVFLTEGTDRILDIETMPGVHKYSVDMILRELQKPVDQGLNAIALFPSIEDEKKDEQGSNAFEPDNLICTAIRAIKEVYPSLGLICDVALDPYTDHAHDGIIYKGQVDNDRSLKKLVKQSLLLSDAGCDILAPSDMMDGRVGIIRDALEKKEHHDVMIMSYAVKYASALYGPFRNAVNAGKLIEPSDKKSYQINVSNSFEAMHEIAMDVNEGADMIMIKPGLPYLDIITKAKDTFGMPTYAYQVSGEYSMIKSAARNNYIQEEETILETMLCFKRAGADGIFTYFTPYLLNLLDQNSY